MNNASQQMQQWLDDADAKRAEQAFAWLRRHLETGLFEGSDAAQRVIESDVEAHSRLFVNDPQMCKVVERAAGTLRLAVQRGHRPDDIRLVQTVAAMFSILVLAAEEANAPTDTVDAFACAHEQALRQALSLASEQVGALCCFIVEVHTFLRELSLGNGRVVLIEMPAGNSVPVKLLSRLMNPVAPVEVVRAALSRKSLKAVGITRRALPEEQLREASLRANDVVVYIDEWETGSNFNTICGFLRKLVPSDAFLLPAAIQSNKASQHPRCESFCTDHDKLCEVWGTTGHRFRRLLPPLPSTLGGGYFFWSEHDRTAGYRKMQLHGAVFSSIDEAVERLHTDEEARRAAAQIILAELASEEDLPGNPGQGIGATLELFEKSYLDYKECRDELQRCADDLARGGTCDDFDAAMEQVLSRYHEILNHRKAKLAVCMASAFIRRIGSIDPTDRYHFDDQAPILVELEGTAARTHEIVMDVLNRRIDELIE